MEGLESLSPAAHRLNIRIPAVADLPIRVKQKTEHDKKREQKKRDEQQKHKEKRTRETKEKRKQRQQKRTKKEERKSKKRNTKKTRKRTHLSIGDDGLPRLA